MQKTLPDVDVQIVALAAVRAFSAYEKWTDGHFKSSNGTLVLRGMSQNSCEVAFKNCKQTLKVP